MLLSSLIISELIGKLSQSTILSKSCECIKSYEAKNLPVPIKKTYFAFSVTNNRTTFFFSEDGEKMQNTDLTISVNCYTPLSHSPTATHTLAETILYFLSSQNSLIDSFALGATEYDKDVDAYKISCELHYNSIQKVDV